MSMSERLHLPARARRDPWWDVEGRSVRNRRRVRRSLALSVLAATVLLVGTATRSPDVQRGAAVAADLAAAGLSSLEQRATR